MKFDARNAWSEHLEDCDVCASGPSFCDEGAILAQSALDERDEFMELWSLTSTGPVFGEVRGAQLFQTHPREVCEADGYPCCLHSPSDHHMREWRMLYRADRGLMERICPCHGIGHPDPDDLAFHIRNDRAWQGVHGCVIPPCCQPTKEDA